MTGAERAIWKELLVVQDGLCRTSTTGSGQNRLLQFAYRDGLLKAFEIVTGEDQEATKIALEKMHAADHGHPGQREVQDVSNPGVTFVQRLNDSWWTP